MLEYNIDVYLRHTEMENMYTRELIELVTNDFNGNIFNFTIYQTDKSVYDLTGKTVTLIVKSSKGTVIEDTCELIDSIQGKAKITLPSDMFCEDGTYYAELQIWQGTNRITTLPFDYTVRLSLDTDEAVKADNRFNLLQEALNNVADANETANNAMVTANSAKTIVDDLVPKANQASINAQAALDRAQSIVTQGELSEKVKINGTSTNVNLISSGETVESLNGKKFASNTDIITDSGSILQSKINRVFYKNMCKEFTSDGSAISVNNGMDGYILSGKIEGQTVKNIASKSSTILENTTRVQMSNKGISKLTKYTVFFKSDKTDSNVILQEEKTDAIWVTNIKVGVTQGINKIVYTSSNIDGLVGLRFSGTGTPIYPISITDFVILEGEYTNNPLQNSIPFGLSSTQAIISNNGQQYPIYATEEDKVSKTPISCGGFGGVYDATIIVEDGSGVYVKNTNVYIPSQNDNFAIANTTDTMISFELVKSDVKLSTNGILCNAMPTEDSASVYLANKRGCATSPSKACIRICLNKSDLTTQDVAGLKTYLINMGVVFRYQLANPIVTHIPKELVPTILTQTTNEFTFGDGVMATKATISVPVNRIADFETRIAQLEKVITSTSNLSILGNYAEDEYNKEINQL